MKEISYLNAIETTTEHLQHGGVFLSVGGEAPNTMTIGWGSVGCIWNRPVFMVLVRAQRHTYDLLRAAGEFTVSVPTKNPLKQELAFAGTQSGRDFDKFTGHGISAAPAQLVKAPIVRECGLHFECRTLLTQDMTPDRMDPSIIQYTYRAGDFHTMFFGEILRCYSTDGE